MQKVRTQIKELVEMNRDRCFWVQILDFQIGRGFAQQAGHSRFQLPRGAAPFRRFVCRHRMMHITRAARMLQ